MEKQLRRLKPNKVVFIGLLNMVLASASVSWAQIVVTTLADSGSGSLRQAIIDASADGVATTITFDPVVFPPPPAAPGLILLSSALPNLNGTGDTIDGTGAGVVLDGSNTPTSPATVGLRVRRRDVTIRGLTIQNFPGDGIRVETTPPPTTNVAVTGVVIDGNTLLANGNRGIRISGGIRTSAGQPVKTVSATVTNNTVSDSATSGILVVGNLQDVGSGDIGGNNVTAVIDGNTVKRSKQSLSSGALAGDGIQVVGGTGDGSNNTVTATISNNTVLQNRDDGIIAVGCGLEDAGSNNTVNVTIIGNTVKESGLNADLTTNSGIVVSGASGEEETSTTCVGNTIVFNISNNVVTQSKSHNIRVAGGTGSGHELSGIVSGNSAKDSPEGDGIQISGGRGTGNHVHDIVVSGNQVSGNFDRGILIVGGNNGVNNLVDGIDIVGNSVRTNGNQGILVSGGTLSENAVISDILIDANTSNSNGTRGIHVTRGTSLSAFPPIISLAGITNNATSRNFDDGIFIASGIPGNNTPVSGNRADTNGVDGIDIDATGYAVSNNTASRNTVDGINAVGNTNGGGNKATQNASCNTPGCF
jgi:Right handed beta helix region